jgi:hypothetical protein
VLWPTNNLPRLEKLAPMFVRVGREIRQRTQAHRVAQRRLLVTPLISSGNGHDVYRGLDAVAAVNTMERSNPSSRISVAQWRHQRKCTDVTSYRNQLMLYSGVWPHGHCRALCGGELLKHLSPAIHPRRLRSSDAVATMMTSITSLCGCCQWTCVAVGVMESRSELKGCVACWRPAAIICGLRALAWRPTDSPTTATIPV